MQDFVYFELNNWTPGIDYPGTDRFDELMGDDSHLYFADDEEWVKENKLCVVMHFVDQSVNVCAAATREWVEDNCPELLTEFTQFLREPDDDGHVYGRWGVRFLEYSESNIGIHYVRYPDCLDNQD